MSLGTIQHLQKKEYAHGTRARYVAQKCRCDLCRAANTEYAKQLALRKTAEVVAVKNVPAVYATKLWRDFEGKPKLLRMRICPGVGGGGCPSNSHLRKDSKGGICGKCRDAATYDGYVSAEKAREHLRWLSSLGIGVRTVAEACDAAESILKKIFSGKQTTIRATTEAKVLGVTEDCRRDGCLVDAKKTWQRIEELQQVGVTKKDIMARLGHTSGSIYLYMPRDMVTARREKQVEKLHRKVISELEKDPGVEVKKVRRWIREMLREEGVTRRKIAQKLGVQNLVLPLYKGYVPTKFADRLHDVYAYFTGGHEEPEPLGSKFCVKCGLSHDQENRLRRLRRMLPCEAKDVIEAYPCVYKVRINTHGGQEARMVARDMHALGAVPRGARWEMPTTESKTA